MNKTITLEQRNASMTLYPVETNKPLPIIVICPGGAYSWRSDREGEPVAKAFRSAGFHAAVLHYDVEPDVLEDGPLLDLSAAVRYLRTHAQEFYPVVTAGPFAHRMSMQRLTPDTAQQLDYSLETKVTRDTPPTFLWHTMTDHSVPVQNSLLFASALLEHEVSCEVMLFPRGEHGLSLATKEVENESHQGIADVHIARWFDQCRDWIENIILCN